MQRKVRATCYTKHRLKAVEAPIPLVCGSVVQSCLVRSSLIRLAPALLGFAECNNGSKYGSGSTVLSLSIGAWQKITRDFGRDNNELFFALSTTDLYEAILFSVIDWSHRSIFQSLLTSDNSFQRWGYSVYLCKTNTNHFNLNTEPCHSVTRT